MSTALVYLSRGIDGGLCSAIDFFNAYRNHPPGCDHELIIITKGWDGIDGIDKLRDMALSLNARIFNFPDDGLDWGAYMRLAPCIDHTWICFLNSHSRPLACGWLKALKDALGNSEDRVGAAGSTGSWEGTKPRFPPDPSIIDFSSIIFYIPRCIYTLLIFLAELVKFPMFPNPHLRSNAFIVQREVFVEFSSRNKIPISKRDSLALESGRAGFTKFLQSRHLEVLVVGRNGHAFNPSQWINSGTFRVPGQTNLLVSDNQTLTYEKSDPSRKSTLEKCAWGRQLS